MFEDITRISKMAKEALKNNPLAINATMGVLHDDNGQVMYSQVFDELISELKPNEKYPYDNVGGPDTINNNILNFLEQDDLLDRDHFSIVTAGGTGALSCVMNLFNEDGGLVVTNLCWGNYLLIAKQNGLKVHGYNMFKDGKYDFDAYESSLKESVETHKNTIILINTPSHNPTGYDMNTDELTRIVEITNKYVRENKNIVFMLDIAYYNYGINHDLSFVKKISKDIIFALVYSFSKSLGIYGLRLGTLTMASHNNEELKARCISFARGTWSSPNHMACSIVEKIITDDFYKQKVMLEIEKQKEVLKQRSEIILNELAKHDIHPCPYKNGFFITIEVEDPEQVAYKLHLKDIYVTTIANAVRIAISGIPTNRIIDITNEIINVIKNI